MDGITVELHESMKDFVRERVTAGGYGSVGEYIRDLIQADQKREERIDALLLEGLDSGEPVPIADTYWEEKKLRLAERVGKTVVVQ